MQNNKNVINVYSSQRVSKNKNSHNVSFCYDLIKVKVQKLPIEWIIWSFSLFIS